MPVSGSPNVTTSEYFWNNVTLAGLTTSEAVNVLNSRYKGITFVSDTNGTLTIETDPAGDGGWDTYDTVTITVNVREDYIFPSGMQHAKVRLVFSVAAVVTGSITML